MLNRIIFYVLFVLVTSAVVSCDDEAIIGRELLPDEDIVALTIDSTFELGASTSTIDPALVYGDFNAFIGCYTDELGTFKSSFVTDFVVSAYSNPFPDGYTSGKVVLSIAYKPVAISDNFYGDITKEQEIEVYLLNQQIADSLDASANINDIYNDKKYATIKFTPGEDSIMVASTGFSVLSSTNTLFNGKTTLNDAIERYTDVKFKNYYDFSDSVRAYINFKELDDELSMEMDDLLDDIVIHVHDVVMHPDFMKKTPGKGFIFGDAVGDDLLKEILPGLYFKTLSSSNAAIMPILLGEYTKLSFYYTYLYTNSETQVSTVIANHSDILSNKGFNVFEQSYSTELQAKLEDENTDNLHVQGMTGLQTVVELPDLSEFKDKSILKAELQFNIDYQKQDTVHYQMPDAFELYYFDEKNMLWREVLDYYSASTDRFEGVNNGKLTFTISRMIQNHLLENEVIQRFALRVKDYESDYRKTTLKGLKSDDNAVKLIVKCVDYDITR